MSGYGQDIGRPVNTVGMDGAKKTHCPSHDHCEFPECEQDCTGRERVINISDSAARKEQPVVTGFMDYFPDAIRAIAAHSKRANDKHNPGEPMHWAKEKSADHADCLGRHQATRKEWDPEFQTLHMVAVGWRAMAQLQVYIDEHGFDAVIRELENGE